MFKKIANGLFGFFPAGDSCSAYFLPGGTPALIDSGLPSAKLFLASELKKTGFSAGDVKLVLHTHGHFDHFAADEIFPNAKILMHKSDAEPIKAHDANASAAAAFGGNYFPKITDFFSEGQPFGLAPFRLKVVFTPGHSKGSVCFLDKRHGLLFSGDTVFQDGFGRTDLAGGNSEELFASIKKLSKLDFKTILPGHGLPFDETPKALLGRAKALFQPAFGGF